MKLNEVHFNQIFDDQFPHFEFKFEDTKVGRDLFTNENLGDFHNSYFDLKTSGLIVFIYKFVF